jgi:hypothetical protein
VVLNGQKYVKNNQDEADPLISNSDLWHPNMHFRDISTKQNFWVLKLGTFPASNNQSRDMYLRLFENVMIGWIPDPEDESKSQSTGWMFLLEWDA